MEKIGLDREHAWGEDELLPISQTSNRWFDLGLTLVDSLDTLLIMGLKEEFLEARNWVDTSLRVDPDLDVNLFETTIRVLGGLLASFHLSAGDQVPHHTTPESCHELKLRADVNEISLAELHKPAVYKKARKE